MTIDQTGPDSSATRHHAGDGNAEPTRVIINLDQPGPRISRHLYGHFAEHLGRCIYGGFWVGEDSPIPNIHGIRADVVNALKDLDIPNLRWPGGCFADEYHWKDGIGPRSQRPRMVNSNWGDMVEDNSFGSHEFMELCELLGADAYITGNLGSGTVREMSQWVEYLTRDDASPMADLRRRNGRDDPWRVPFFGLGNEAWGCGGNMKAEFYTCNARQYASFVKDHGTNKVTKIAAGASDDDYGWTDALMRSFGDLTGPDTQPEPFQAISFHYYTLSGTWEDKGSATQFSDDEYYRTMERARFIEELLTRHSTVMDRYDPHKKVGLVLDEWGTWWNVEPGTNPGFLYQQNTVRDALVAALHFDAFHRHADRLVMANIAQTVNVLQAMVLTDPDTHELVLTPSYYVFAMNKGHHDAQAVPCSIRPGSVHHESVSGGAGANENSELEMISASASVKMDQDQALISVTNLDLSTEHEVLVDLRGFQIGDAHATVLTSGDIHDYNTTEHPHVVTPQPGTLRSHPRGVAITMPAHSFATIQLELAEQW